jgi:S-formylglutathione hydrolase FrmB
MAIVLRGLLVLAFLTPAAAQSRIDCNALNSHTLGQLVHYCVLLPPGYDREARAYPVLYFLHGLGENEQTLFQTGGWTLIDDLRKGGHLKDFLIVTPEGRASFYVNSADGKTRYSDFFVREFVPMIEGHYRIRRERAWRAITGISMGGYGALRFAFAYPEMFSAVSAQSAALMTATPQQLNATLQSGTPLGRLLGAVFGNPIDIAHWRENDPFALARKNRIAISRLAIYFNCGDDDQYDFEKGAEALHRQLDGEHIKHEYHLYPGDHSAPYFLRHLGEVIEFHSQHFAAGK